jgi:hypothetical protein
VDLVDRGASRYAGEDFNKRSSGMTGYRVTFEYRERGRKARRRGSRVFKRYPNPEAIFSQMLCDLGFSARVDELNRA